MLAGREGGRRVYLHVVILYELIDISTLQKEGVRTERATSAPPGSAPELAGAEEALPEPGWLRTPLQSHGGCWHYWRRWENVSEIR